MARRTKGLARMSRIVSVLVQQGLGFAVDEFGLRWHLPLLSRFTFHGNTPPSDLPRRVRQALEDLGGAYLKLGQLLSTRPDLVPAEYAAEFRKLLDRAHPAPFEQVRKTVESELERPLESAFSSFNKLPLGAASVAQVHYARLKSGCEVVVKVQRPHVRETFAADIDILYYIAHKLARHRRFKGFAPLSIVTEFDRYTKRELDFLVEAHTIDTFNSLFAHSKHIVIPKIHWQHCTSRMLVMDYLPGKKLSDMLHKPVQRPALAKALGNAMITQIFDKGVFHADLHPGNIVLCPGNRIGLLDFGITGVLEPSLRRQLLELYAALIQHEPERIVRLLLRLGTPSDQADLGDFERQTRKILAIWYSDPEHMRPTQMMQQLFSNCYKHDIQLPADIILFGKAIVTVESTALLLDPTFDFMRFSSAQIMRLMRKHVTTSRLAKGALKRARTVSSALLDLPQEALDTLERFKQGSFRVQLADTDVRHLGFDLELSSNRVSLAIMSASFVLGGSMLIDVGPQIFGYPVLSTIALGFAVILFSMISVSILREGKKNSDPHSEKYK